jgi:hypothetical protein
MAVKILKLLDKYGPLDAPSIRRLLGVKSDVSAAVKSGAGSSKGFGCIVYFGCIV